VIIVCEDGSEDHRSGGTRAWRNNNPGNIRSGRFADDQGSLGEAGGFAVFENETTGQTALTNLLRTDNYQNLSVSGAIARYAPPTENNTAAYQEAVRRATGLDPDAMMNTLTDAQLQSVANAIRQHEGWREGTVENRRPQQQ
jgi:hypothetical protein